MSAFDPGQARDQRRMRRVCDHFQISCAELPNVRSM